MGLSVRHPSAKQPKIGVMKKLILLMLTVPSFFMFGKTKTYAQQNSSNAATGYYQYDTTRQLVRLVKNAAAHLLARGEAAFKDFRTEGSEWRRGESYVFVLDTRGNMLVHPDRALEGNNTLDLKDINGKPIIRGLLAVTYNHGHEHAGWYHYQWPVPGSPLPRWKSTYAMRISTGSGKEYIVASGVYNDRMEREFVVDAVNDAVAHIEKKGKDAFALFHDPAGPYMMKDAYIFVTDSNGVELVNPAFPNLEGRNLLDLKDTEGKYLVREMLAKLKSSGSGWVNYLWPKPGESISTEKATYVSKAKMGNQWVLVGCGVYLTDAPKATKAKPPMSAAELLTLVRDAAKLLEQQGEKALPAFREKGSRWFHDDTYFFLWTLDGTRIFHAADPAGEGMDVSRLKDVQGRPIGQMCIETGATPGGEGWIHYLYPEPGNIFPVWKSTYIKRITFPSGEQYLLGCGIYNMQMNRTFIEELVNRAANLVASQGAGAFNQLRSKTGPFVFMNVYVFVQDTKGTELVNAAQPSLEGQNLLNLRDLKGKLVVKEQRDAVLKKGSTWLSFYWYRPGDNTPALKHTYVRKVPYKGTTYIVGAGFYAAER